jgi:divalent metal cation (Fe/Co/Zn/Cd) transporter
VMTTVKQFFTFIASIGLICAGLFFLYEELFVRFSGSHGRYGMFAAGLIFVGSGVHQLWFYFLLPFLLRKRAPL